MIEQEMRSANVLRRVMLWIQKVTACTQYSFSLEELDFHKKEIPLKIVAFMIYLVLSSHKLASEFNTSVL